MSKEPKCEHGHLIAGCIYCALGSKNKEDADSKISDKIIELHTQKQKVRSDQINMALKQRNIIISALFDITGHVYEQDLKVGESDCEDCNKVLGILAKALRKCHDLEDEFNKGLE